MNRRDFLKGLGIGVGTLVLVGVKPAQEKPETQEFGKLAKKTQSGSLSGWCTYGTDDIVVEAADDGHHFAFETDGYRSDFPKDWKA